VTFPTTDDPPPAPPLKASQPGRRQSEADHENYVAYLEAEAEREQALDYFEREDPYD
jgi:hypothetical protein